MGWEGIDIFTLKDLLIAPVYVLIIYFLATMYAREYKGQSKRKYFMPALHLRMLGCFLSVMMYQYYYHGGDMFGYHAAVTTMNEIFWADPWLGLDMMTSKVANLPPETLPATWSSMGSYVFRAYNSLLLCQIGTFLSLVTFNSCLVIGLILAYFSFVGSWKLFEVFADLFPHLEKYLAWATLFIPSVVFWGSAGLMKDTLLMATIGYFTWSAYFLFFKGQKKMKAATFLVISFLLMYYVKSYVAMAFIPALVAWLVLNYNKKIKSNGLKILAFPLIIGIAAIASFFLFQRMAATGGKYAPENLVNYIQVVQWDHYYRTGGSVYDLGEFDPSARGLVKLAPAAIMVTLFRPFPWEASNPLLLLSSLEGLVFLLLTLYVFFKSGIFTTLRTILTEPTVLFCLSFALIFSFAVGVSAYNFGALARYKIPALPFYFVALVILLDKAGVFADQKKPVEASESLKLALDSQ